MSYRQEYDFQFNGDFNGMLAKVQEGGIVDSRQLEQEYVQNHYYEKDYQ